MPFTLAHLSTLSVKGRPHLMFLLKGCRPFLLHEANCCSYLQQLTKFEYLQRASHHLLVPVFKSQHAPSPLSFSNSSLCQLLILKMCPTILSFQLHLYMQSRISHTNPHIYIRSNTCSYTTLYSQSPQPLPFTHREVTPCLEGQGNIGEMVSHGQEVQVHSWQARFSLKGKFC